MYVSEHNVEYEWTQLLDTDYSYLPIIIPPRPYPLNLLQSLTRSPMAMKGKGVYWAVRAIGRSYSVKGLLALTLVLMDWKSLTVLLSKLAGGGLTVVVVGTEVGSSASLKSGISRNIISIL